MTFPRIVYESSHWQNATIEFRDKLSEVAAGIYEAEMTDSWYGGKKDTKRIEKFLITRLEPGQRYPYEFTGTTASGEMIAFAVEDTTPDVQAKRFCYTDMIPDELIRAFEKEAGVTLTRDETSLDELVLVQPYAELLACKGLRITTISGLEVGSRSAYIALSNGTKLHMHHDQQCGEDVEIESVVGDILDLIDSPLLVAEVSQNDSSSFDLETFNESKTERDDDGEIINGPQHSNGTWTFYKLGTIKGTVDIRWIGASNGHYSEEVDVTPIEYDKSLFKGLV